LFGDIAWKSFTQEEQVRKRHGLYAADFVARENHLGTLAENAETFVVLISGVDKTQLQSSSDTFVKGSEILKACEQCFSVYVTTFVFNKNLMQLLYAII